MLAGISAGSPGLPHSGDIARDRIGIYGPAVAVPEEFGGTPVSMPRYVQVTEEQKK